MRWLVMLLPFFAAMTPAVAAPIKWEHISQASGLPSNRILCVFADADAVWVGTDNGLVEIQQGRITKIFTTKAGLASNVITALSPDDFTGDLWIATYGGVSRYSAGIFRNYTALASGLANDIVYDISAGKGFVWAATAAGLSRLDLRTGSWTNFDELNTPLIDPWPTRMMFADGKAYVASWGNGVLEYDLATDQWTQRRYSQTIDPGTAANSILIRDFVTGVAFDPSSKPSGSPVMMDSCDRMSTP